MGIVGWIVLGIIAGAIAKLLKPGRDPGGLLITMLLGIAGALIGGFVATLFGLSGITGFNFWSMLLAVGGALVLLAIYDSMGRPGRRRWI